MSELEKKIGTIVEKSYSNKEYEKAFIACKKFSKTLNRAILGQADKKEIESAIIAIQSSLEIVKIVNGSTTKDIEKGVYDTFGIKPPVITQPKTTATSKSNSKSTTTRKK